MAVAIIMDFPGGSREQYDEVIRRMQLDGRMPAGGLFHAAGRHEGDWRVIDVWEDMPHFAAFRDSQIGPHSAAVGLSEPDARVLEVTEQKPGSGRTPVLVQCVFFPGLDEDDFHALDREVLADGTPPPITFHVNGPFDGGWCVIDAWDSREEHDRFIAERVRPAAEHVDLQEPPRIEELTVEATLESRATAAA